MAAAAAARKIDEEGLNGLFDDAVLFFPRKVYVNQYCTTHAVWLNQPVFNCLHSEYLSDYWQLVYNPINNNDNFVAWTLFDTLKEEKLCGSDLDYSKRQAKYTRTIRVCQHICSQPNSVFFQAIKHRIDTLNNYTKISINKPHSLVRRRLLEITDLIKMVQEYIPQGHVIKPFCGKCDYRYGPEILFGSQKKKIRRDFRIEYHNSMRKRVQNWNIRKIDIVPTEDEEHPSRCDDPDSPNCDATDP